MPEKILTNKDLEKIVETTDEWILERTGIKKRHIAAENEMTADLAANAAKQALLAANINPDSIDLIIVATTTPENTFPSTATKVQAILGAKNAAAFDVQAVCSGFIYALNIADNFIKTGQTKRALVIGADVLTRILDWKDRGTCVLFGDGAGAVILEGTSEKGRGILTSSLYSDGTTRDILYVDGGVASTKTAGVIKMLGQEVFKMAVTKLAECVETSLKKVNLTTKDIDWLVPHQANIRILQSTAKKLSIPIEKVVITVENHANTSAASIPLALDVAVRDGRIKKGNIVALEAIGAGMTWGASIVKW